MITGRQWTLAAALAVGVHVALFAIAAPSPELAMEHSAGRPGVVWGLPFETVADTVDPSEAAETPPEADERTDVEANEAEIAETSEAEVAEAVPDETRDVEPVETAEAADVPDPSTEVADTRPEVPVEVSPSEATPVETETAAAVDDRAGGVAVPVPVSESDVPLVEAEEVRTAMLSPAAEPEPLEAQDYVPTPRTRPADVPRVETPPARRPPEASKPKKTTPAKSPPKTAAAKPVPQPSSATGARPSAAPAGEQVGTGGKRVADGGKALLSSYAGRVAAHLQRYKRYPGEAARNRLSGTAVVTFTLGADGRVRASKLSRGSGQSVFDQEVMAMVQRASPFPPIPRDTGKSSYTFTVPVHFKPR